MTLPGLAIRSLANRRFAIGLTVLTIALSIALLVLVEQLRSEVREGFYRSVSGTDLIVGARTSPVQLLLYSVFGLGEPTNNVSWETYTALAGTEEVAWAVPISLGDAHQGYRVVGTEVGFFDHYRYADRQPLAFSNGARFDDLFDVVIGHQVARNLGYGLGDELVLAHGTARVSLQQHDNLPFTVSGILAPTGTPIDQQLYISLAAHEALHLGWQNGVPRPGANPSDEQARAMAERLTPDSVTAILLGLTTRAAVFGLQRRVNEYRQEALSAVLPGIALQQLWRITGLAEQILRVVAGLVVLSGLLGMLTVLLTTLNERRREMAILRANGARPVQIAGLLIFEAGLLAAAGILLGLVLAFAVQALAAPFLLSTVGVNLAVGWPSALLWKILGGIWLAGLVVGAVPALMAYRRTLADGMQVRM
ncbi:peptide ABC transporter permease [Leptolyngbya valderiana BDU 20041]|nr:peptide ABC transporter permease [Leptolyngbya valderiana BDU 20041]